MKYGTYYNGLNGRPEFYYGTVEKVTEVFHKLTKELGWGSMNIHNSLDELNRKVNEEMNRKWSKKPTPNYYINVDTNEEQMIMQ